MITSLDSEFSEINHFLENNHYSKLFILVDENTHEHCLPVFLPNLKTNIPFEIIEIEAGEEMKNIDTAKTLWEILAEFKADRNSLLINLGGGMITDLGGFIASTYKRGIDFIHLPTSLLGMCDASIGGKNGIDLGFLKNMVGTFNFPQKIFIYPQFLKTLPYEELRSGFAEMLKHGLINDYQHYKDLSSIDNLTVDSIAPYIKTSMEIKNKLVKKDFKEQNIRKTLNFGHTFGHAIEGLYLKKQSPVAHGHAVAIGMIMEAYLSYLENHLSENDCYQMMEKLLKFYPLLSIHHFSNEEIIEQMLNDKKNNTDKINFSLLNNLGSAIYNQYPSLDNINNTIIYYKNLS